MMESTEDFKKRYKGTYVFLTIGKEKHLSKFVDNLLIEDREVFKFVSHKVGDILLKKEDAMESISLRFPKQQLYNINNEACVFYRIPARQWKRAPCQENSNIVPILSFFNGTPTIAITNSTVDQLFKEDFPKDLDTAIKQMNLSIAISPKFAISATNTNKKNQYLLWYKSNPIGYVEKDSRQINIFNSSFFQEILDLCKYKEHTWNPNLVNL